MAGGASTNFSANRAFIQWAGFTFGLAQSFYDFYSGPAVSYYGGQIVPASDTGDGGNWVGAYTAQFGNGLSASISAEDDRQNRATGVYNPLNANALALGTTYTNSYAAPNTPDIVANLRVDQAWGGAQVMGAIHQVTANYNSATLGSAGMAQHASDQTGFAVGVGVKINAPMIGKGDYLQAQANYTQGALGYLFAGRGDALFSAFRGGGTYGYGVVADGVVSGTAAASTLELTTGWGVNASYEHFWNGQWKTSVYGVYDDIKYDAAANTTICANSGALLIAAAGNPLCNNDFQYWAVGSRTQWNVTPQFYMGVDVVYAKLQTASAGMTTGTGAAAPAAATSQPSGLRTVQDQDAWIGYFRVHYDFYP
jgi:hypothetical protein